MTINVAYCPLLVVALAHQSLTIHSMKYFSLLCIAVAACIVSSAQKDFEGIVTYRIMGPEKQENEERGMTVYFAPGRILVRTTYERSGNETLIHLDSGKIYRLRHEQKDYQVNNMLKVTVVPERAPKTILGYSSKAIKATSTWGMDMSTSASLYISDDLTYHIPPQYNGNELLAMIYNDHIILDGIIYIDNIGFSGNDKEDKHNFITLEATKVEPQTINRLLLEIPKDYTAREGRYYPPTMDSVTIKVDTVVEVPETPPPPPPAKKPPVKKPTSPKTTNQKPAMSNKQ